MAHDILVIGASAGGVEALMTLVAGLPASLRASLFIVMHLPASRPSALPKILNRSGPLPARHAQEGMLIEQGTIFVAPPDHHLVFEQEHMHLERGAKEHAVRPAVDVLFRSAATTYGPRVVGIILTGAGIDGTAGLRAIKQYGGLTIVQHPEEARFPSMPHNAREQMQVDYLSPVANIASLLISLVNQDGRRSIRPPTPS